MDSNKDDTRKMRDVREESPSKCFNTTTQIEEKLTTLESRIRVVKSDFKAQVDDLRSRMERLKTELENVHDDLNSRKMKDAKNDDDARRNILKETRACRKHLLQKNKELTWIHSNYKEMLREDFHHGKLTKGPVLSMSRKPEL